MCITKMRYCEITIRDDFVFSSENEIYCVIDCSLSGNAERKL